MPGYGWAAGRTPEFCGLIYGLFLSVPLACRQVADLKNVNRLIDPLQTKRLLLGFTEYAQPWPNALRATAQVGECRSDPKPAYNTQVQRPADMHCIERA